MRKLNGSIGTIMTEKCHITGGHIGEFGEYGRVRVLGCPSAGERIVRFSAYDPERSEWSAHHLTSNVAEIPQYTEYGKYALVAHWERWMRKNRDFPTFLEISSYFRPSDRVDKVFYLQSGNSRHGGRVMMFGAGKMRKCHNSSLGSILKQNICAGNGTNITLVETDEDLGGVREYYTSQGILPIVLEPVGFDSSQL